MIYTNYRFNLQLFYLLEVYLFFEIVGVVLLRSVIFAQIYIKIDDSEKPLGWLAA